MKNGATIESLPTTKLSPRSQCCTRVTDLYFSNRGQVLEEQQGGSSVAQYMWTPFYANQMRGQDDTQLLARHVYIEPDATYNVTSLTEVQDSVKDVVGRYQHDLYGNVTVRNADSSVRGDGTLPSSNYSLNYTFQCGRIDLATGLVHPNARDYDPSMGRWTQQDPAGYIDGANRYQFVDSSPTLATDPSGEVTLEYEQDHQAGAKLFGLLPNVDLRIKSKASLTGGTARTDANKNEVWDVDPAPEAWTQNSTMVSSVQSTYYMPKGMKIADALKAGKLVKDPSDIKGCWTAVYIARFSFKNATKRARDSYLSVNIGPVSFSEAGFSYGASLSLPFIGGVGVQNNINWSALTDEQVSEVFSPYKSSDYTFTLMRAANGSEVAIGGEFPSTWSKESTYDPPPNPYVARTIYVDIQTNSVSSDIGKTETNVSKYSAVK